jgi:hypothetical protein
MIRYSAPLVLNSGVTADWMRAKARPVGAHDDNYDADFPFRCVNFLGALETPPKMT